MKIDSIVKSSFVPDLADRTFIDQVTYWYGKLLNQDKDALVSIKYRVVCNVYDDTMARFLAAYNSRGYSESLYFAKDIGTELPLLDSMLKNIDFNKYEENEEFLQIFYDEMKGDLERISFSTALLKEEFKYLKRENLLRSMNSDWESVNQAIFLQRKLDRLIQKEDFTQAAVYRDAIKNLNLNTI